VGMAGYYSPGASRRCPQWPKLWIRSQGQSASLMPALPGSVHAHSQLCSSVTAGSPTYCARALTVLPHLLTSQVGQDFLYRHGPLFALPRQQVRRDEQVRVVLAEGTPEVVEQYARLYRAWRSSLSA
jgi:hypothetical protein